MKRLSHTDFHKAAQAVSDEADTARHLSPQGIVEFIKQRTGIEVNTAHARQITELVGLEKADITEDLHAAVVAIAERLNWPMATLVTRGHKILETLAQSRMKGNKDQPQLPLVSDAETKETPAPTEEKP